MNIIEKSLRKISIRNVDYQLKCYIFFSLKEGIISEALSPEQRVVSLAPRACTKGIQVFEEHSKESPGDIIGRPVPHNSALQQTTGEAVYVDDMAKLQGVWLIKNQYPVT